MILVFCVFFFKQKTAYEMRISDWSSDVCSSDLQYLEPLGFKVAYTPVGITVALIFIGLPFVVRSVEPVLADLSAEVEEAALSLGARPWQVFARVILPAILPALLTGFALALDRKSTRLNSRQ